MKRMMTAEVNGRRSRGQQKKRWGDMMQQGAVHKVRHTRGEGVRVGVTVCDRGEGGQAHVTSRLYIFLSYILNMKFKVMCLTFCFKRYFVTEGGMNKNHPRQKPPQTKPSKPKTLWQTLLDKNPANNSVRICT